MSKVKSGTTFAQFIVRIIAEGGTVLLGTIGRVIFSRFLTRNYSEKMAAGKYKIVMVRHGESEWNLKNQFCGWYDANLSENGKVVIELQMIMKYIHSYVHCYNWSF